MGGLIRDGVGALAERGNLGPTLAVPATGYVTVYTIEIVLLFATLVAIGPLVRSRVRHGSVRHPSLANPSFQTMNS